MNNSAIKEIAFQLGADVCGIAGIDRFAKTPEGFHPADVFPQTESVIIFGKPFVRSVFKAKSNAPYTLVRNMLIQKIDEISLRMAERIEEEGFDAVPIPSSEPYEFWDALKRHGRGILSMKHAAELAGLGHIGRNTLLINREYGNRLWLGAVLTGIALESDQPADTACPPDCRICLDACPMDALDGTTIDQKRCRQICQTSTEGGGWLLSCNLCREKCPFSRV
ncbi:epoxyqueuosine reductase [bacterium]|nr:epoxyqueuosine reductase [bacterium]